MRVIPPLTITDAIVTSSSVPETPPANAYDPAVAYVINDKRYVAAGAVPGSLLSVYQSLQNANTGHNPATSPTWWKYLGDTYSVYAGGHAYAIGDIIIRVETHHAYQSQVGANSGNTPETSPTQWLDLGPDNYWAMFDLLRNSQSVTPQPIVVVLTPGKRVDSIALGGLVATSARVVMTSVAGGGTVYDKTFDLNTRLCYGWYDYFFKPFTTKPSLVAIDLPPYTDCIITVTITNDRGNAACGSLVVGKNVYIGQIQWDPIDDATNYSSFTRDAFGKSQLVARRSVPQVHQTVIVDKNRVDDVRALRDALNAVIAVWTGIDDNSDGIFESLLKFGVYTTFSFDHSNVNESILTLEVQEY